MLMPTSGRYRKRRVRVVFAVVLMVIAVVALDAFTSQHQTSPPQPDKPATLAAEIEDGQSAIEALGKLAVKESVSRQGYARDHFSPGWGRVDGCDMRNRILQRDLVKTELESNGCTVLAGVLREDPYTGERIEFIRGPGTSNAVQIEHIVAVSDAWQKGAQDLPQDTRWQFYNDPLNLIAVDGPANMQKGDKDAANWLPRKEYRCRYVARQIAVKLKYTLWVTQPEYDAMRRILLTCPDQILPIQK